MSKKRWFFACFRKNIALIDKNATVKFSIVIIQVVLKLRFFS
jgi:hypothetical protein